MLSPILFTLYIDDLLGDLQDQGVGCFWDSFFAGAMGYAEDIVLLAPSPSALRIMLRCCEDFAFRRGLRLNPSKTQLIHCPPPVQLTSTFVVSSYHSLIQLHI